MAVFLFLGSPTDEIPGMDILPYGDVTLPRKVLPDLAQLLFSARKKKVKKVAAVVLRTSLSLTRENQRRQYCQ